MKNFAVIPFNSNIILDKHLVSNMLGAWDILDNRDFRLFSSFKCGQDTPLFNRLYERGLVVDERNVDKLLDEYRSLNSNLFCDTSLHIAVLTTHCNLRCKYCQAKTKKPMHMDLKVARRVIQYIKERYARHITLEFQGGEPTLNWDVFSFLVKSIRKLPSADRKISIMVVTNLTMLDDEKLQFLNDFSVDVCTSLDGPKYIHNRNRVFSSGKGTYDIVVKNIKKLNKKFKKDISLLPTITKHSLKAYKDIIDEYVRLGQTNIALRPVNYLGNACGNWSSLGYSADEFIEFYKKSLDYILKLNKKGILIKERMARVILTKIFNKQDPGYVDLMNPCGAGRSQIVYMPDGSCYPCDEARMVGDEMFLLGSILKEPYEAMIKKENLLHLLEASAVNLWDYTSAFSPWIGICPILNYVTQKNFVTKIKCSSLYKIHTFQFKYIFEKISAGGQDLEILKTWVQEGGRK
ncbi:MAG: His-Xaa-Ser system radical SAM maturase HxsB [Candidatus Omnitrophota bacterium]|jgi:His-Xaa-Ser system radical SAM maturase HxsB